MAGKAVLSLSTGLEAMPLKVLRSRRLAALAGCAALVLGVADALDTAQRSVAPHATRLHVIDVTQTP